MKKHISYFISIALLAFLTSCNFPLSDVSDLFGSQTESPIEGGDQQGDAGQPDEADEPQSEGVLPAQSNDSISESVSESDYHLGEIVLSEQCNHITPGLPMDVSIPDGTQMEPGESFTKIWRFVNSGSCSWTTEYSIVLFSGDFLGYFLMQYFEEAVLPGGSVDIKIDMVAPNQPGFYQSNWKIRSANGVLFGIGPRGSAPFWVNIEVVGERLIFQEPEPTMVPSSTVLLSGNVILAAGDHFDLDDGDVNPSTGSDISFFINSEDIEYLAPSNDVEIGLFGTQPPSIDDCKDLSLDNAAYNLKDLESGVCFCYRSNSGLPGYIQIQGIDFVERFMDLDYVTWSAP
jgi:hypothetical protein